MPSGPGADRAFKIATKICKDRGFKVFTHGSEGKKCRGEVAEKIAKRKKSGR